MFHFLRDGGALDDFPSFLVAQLPWPRFLAIQIWLMVLFLVYVTAHELNTLSGLPGLATADVREGDGYALHTLWTGRHNGAGSLAIRCRCALRRHAGVNP